MAQAFIIMQIGNPELDKVYNSVIAPSEEHRSELPGHPVAHYAKLLTGKKIKLMNYPAACGGVVHRESWSW